MRPVALLKVALYLARHPGEGLLVARASWRLRRRQWWRRFPFLPVPSRSYWNFRMVTAFGEERPATIAPREIVTAARWSLAQRAGK
ncbi:MAG: hypothetical protein KGJ10_02625 [Acidobacteriota bacterium]|nr:hypothetical protein [Acidobacteriota bacterium]MDE3043706.1 hypothetical protein [Acidobacteriota bacterium]MDE3107060.1 hypothetical protein [Acidobacteriota bacterium]MDE3222436.1 hypothetical protein [Acidobacteriota bacterium]